MVNRFLKKLWQQVVRLLVVALVLLAAYVSIGREFMPAVSRYADFVEDQIAIVAGLPVEIGSLTGSFRGFNPSIQINGLQLLVSDADVDSAARSSSLRFERATVVLDVPQSIWRRNWVFEEFVVEGLAVAAEQTVSGVWQLRDVNVSGASNIDLGSVYEAFIRVAQLDLRDVQINLRTRNNNLIEIENGSATIQNRNGNHLLHVNANLVNHDEQLQLSIETRGNSVETISGLVHLRIPDSNYTDLIRGETIGQVTIQDMVAGSEFWLQLQAGAVTEITSRVAVESAALLTAAGDTVSLQDVRGSVRYSSRSANGDFDLAISNMIAKSGDIQWTPFNALIAVRADRNIRVKADLIDLTFLNHFIRNSELLSEAGADQLAGYNPQGKLSNFSLYWPLSESAGEQITIATNLNNVDVGSVNSSPSLWGLDGYLELAYDVDSRIARGFGEVESERFRINIPSVFTDAWSYDYVNGRLDFRVDLNDGQHIHMVSSVVQAESGIVDGRVQFASSINRYDDGRREANLDLLVGALRVDASQKAPYLPNAPTIANSLRQTMQWLEGAVLDGELHNSGVIYRGSTLPNSPPATKTFQSFYVLEEGDLLFSEDWPLMSDVSGFVMTNDELIDIEVMSASSMGISAEEVLASVRRNDRGENWLDITGTAHAATASLLDYLQAAPVGDGLRNAMSTWSAVGDFDADIGVRVPLSTATDDVAVRLDITLENNSLTLPDYALEIQGLSGPVVFDTVTGLETTQLQGELFGEPVAVELSSVLENGALQNIAVLATGAVGPEALIEWPMQSAFVRQLLADMEGRFDYAAQVTVPQAGSNVTTLTIDTTLEGAALTLPYPFAKATADQMPLHLEIQFDETDQDISGQLGIDSGFSLRLKDGAFQGGLVTLGELYADVDQQINLESDGLAVLGQVDRLVVEQWIDYLAATTGAANAGTTTGSSAEISDIISFIDVNVTTLDVFSQALADVDVYLESNNVSGYWDFTLESDAVTGTVNVPYNSNDYLQLTLAHLNLPGDEPEVDETDIEIENAELPEDLPVPEMAAEDAVEERVDVLAAIDPRALPKIKFVADSVTIGSRPFGAWKFTLDPTADGADFTDLTFDFRGLRTVQVEADTEGTGMIEPRFSWHYDGASHRSELQGILQADNIADVLTANGFAPSLNSESATFDARLNWPGSPAFFTGANLSGDLALTIEEGRFQQTTAGSGALKLISIINFDAIMRRLRFSNDLLRSGLAYDTINGRVTMDDGKVTILDQLVISGPSSLYQITGELNLADQTINGEMYLTLPVSANIPWLGLLTANIPLAVGAYLFDRIFGDQVNNLTSAVYTLQGPWEGLQPQFKQAFGSPGSSSGSSGAAAPTPQ